MFKDDVMEVLNIFQEFRISGATQRKIFNEGLYFNYTWGDPDPNHINKHLDFFQVATLLRYLKHNNMKFNLNGLLKHPYNFEYPEIVKMVAGGQIPFDQKVKRRGRKQQ